jgi:hypothetical protein
MSRVGGSKHKAKVAWFALCACLESCQKQSSDGKSALEQMVVALLEKLQRSLYLKTLVVVYPHVQ